MTIRNSWRHRSIRSLRQLMTQVNDENAQPVEEFVKSAIRPPTPLRPRRPEQVAVAESSYAPRTPLAIVPSQLQLAVSERRFGSEFDDEMVDRALLKETPKPSAMQSTVNIHEDVAEESEILLDVDESIVEHSSRSSTDIPQESHHRCAHSSETSASVVSPPPDYAAQEDPATLLKAITSTPKVTCITALRNINNQMLVHVDHIIDMIPGSGPLDAKIGIPIVDIVIRDILPYDIEKSGDILFPETPRNSTLSISTTSSMFKTEDVLSDRQSYEGGLSGWSSVATESEFKLTRTTECIASTRV